MKISQVFISSVLLFCGICSNASSKKVLVQTGSPESFQLYLKKNQGYQSLSDFWIQSFHEIHPQLEGLLDLCLLELTGDPSPESCEKYFLMRSEIPMGGFDHELFEKLRSRLKSQNFKNENLKKWLSSSSNSKTRLSSAQLNDLQKNWGSTKTLVQGVPAEDQALELSHVYQWTFLRDDSEPLTFLGCFAEAIKTTPEWKVLTSQRLVKLQDEFPEARFFQDNFHGIQDAGLDHRLSEFHGMTSSELAKQKSWMQWKLPAALVLTGVLVHFMKDKEVRITAMSF